MQNNNPQLFKQRLLRSHVALGISVSLLLYLAVYFGLFAIFLPQIQTWEKPSRHFSTADITAIDYEPMLAVVLADPDFPTDNIIFELPGVMGDPALKIFHQFTRKYLFNPLTQEEFQDEGKGNGLAAFLNGLHYGRPLQKAGYYLFGFMSVGALFLIVGGLMLIYLLPFGKMGKNQQAIFSRWHRKLFLWGFPLFTIVVISGTTMCLGFDINRPLVYIVTQGEMSSIRPVIGPVLFPEETAVEKTGNPASMLPLNELINQARTIHPGIDFQRLTLRNWGDETAQIRLEGYNPRKPFLNGVTNKPAVILSGHDGSLVNVIKVEDRPWSVLLTDFFFSLHLLFGVGLFIRILVFLVMLACGVAIGFGVMLQLEKKTRKFRENIPFYHWLGKLSLTLMVGVIPATGLLFNLQWLLPFDLQSRLIWQQGLFFDAWLAAFAWSFYRLDSYQAAKEFLTVGGALFLCAPILHAFTSGFTPFVLIQQKLWTILSVDAGLALFGILLVLAARKLPATRDQAKYFWIGHVKGLAHA